MKKIKILYTINFINNGGPSKVLLNTIKCLNKKRYDISILTIINQNDKNIIDDLKKDGINLIEFSMKKRLVDVFKFYKRIVYVINELKPDVIHTHGIVTSIIVSSSKIKGYKITTIHNDVYNDYKYAYGLLKGRLIASVHLKSLQKFDDIVCCSRTSYEAIKHVFKDINYIRNGIDSENINFSKRNQIRKELGLNDDDIVFIYVGVITNRKRVVELIEKFEQSAKKHEHLLILGNGPLFSKAVQIAQNHTHMLGFKKNVNDYLVASDIYVSNSSSEGFSISIIEALECGLSLLVSNIPSHKECFEIDDRYYIGEYFDDENFAEKKNDVILKKESQDRIKKFQKKYLSSEVMTAKYEEYYERGNRK